MQQSQEALQRGDLDGPRNAQQQALQAMSQAAQQMADEARRQSGQSAQNRNDPLGRSSDTGNQVRSRCLGAGAGPAPSWKNCAAAPARCAGRRKSANISTGC